MILIQEQDFSVTEEYAKLNQNAADGAIVFFVGKVRDLNLGDKVTGLFLEHYPAMTEKVLQEIVDEACTRWQLGQVQVIHRVGALAVNDQIVFVGVSSAHREAAFAACEFIMDYLKTRAPFWKKERLINEERWVEAQHKDTQAANHWQK